MPVSLLTRASPQAPPVVGANGVVTGSLVHGRTGAAFSLELALTPGGALRLVVSEPGKARYSPPGVLVAGGDTAVGWGKVQKEPGGSLLLTPPTGDVTYKLTLAPFGLDMARVTPLSVASGGWRQRRGLPPRPSVACLLTRMPRPWSQVAGGTTVMRINSRQLFHIEPLGEKKVRFGWRACCKMLLRLTPPPPPLPWHSRTTLMARGRRSTTHIPIPRHVPCAACAPPPPTP
jgi:hypothetical protein